MSNDDGVRTAGRPRDTTLDGRILDAAREVYARHGWSGFTVKAVATAAGVSRDAVGRRFDTREELLMAALTASGFPLIETRVGQELREWLLELATAVFDVFTRGSGRAYLRIHLDADSVPGLFAAYRNRLLEPGQRMLRDRVAAAARTERRDDLDPGAVVEDVLGPTLMLALLHQDIGTEDRSRRDSVLLHLPAIIERALAPHRSGSATVAARDPAEP
ncbi:TetR/AcrR family transcriptional regulator [Nocardia harenae]|uniref:TetR/AcrR family transcriptional regulator n=1 Tax=Nocardia harenae TaxID=358707 RepID=UPI00083297A5|nr:TetR/AcrR family transcriptional regulator [Nocardia harenae]